MIFKFIKLLVFPVISLDIGGGGGGQTQKSDPWSGVQPYLREGYANLSGLSKTPLQYFPDQTVAGFSPESEQYFSRMQQNAGLGSQVNPAAESQLMKTLQGDYLAPSPYLNESLNYALDPVQQNINSMFSKAGRYGSGAQTGELARQLGGLRSQAYLQNYESERARQNAAMGLAPQFQSALDARENMQAGLMGQVGQARDIKSQQMIDAEKARFDFAQNEPWQRAQNYMSLISPGAGMGGTTTVTPDRGSPVSGALGGAAAGAAMGSMALGPLGTYYGGMLGGGLGLLNSL